MEWNKKLQLIIDYVENHLQRTQEPVDPEEISKIAGCSFGFFQKVFSYMNGISFSDYIRFRKLTLAGYDLKSTDRKVIEVSYRYGYDSPTSFAKAFGQFHGVTPKDAKGKDMALRAVPKMQLLEERQYFWRLEKKEAFRLIGKSICISRKEEEHFAKIPEFWDRCQKNGVVSGLIPIDAGSPKGLFGLFQINETNPDEMQYSIMVNSDAKLPEGFNEIWIPEALWAVFDCRGAIPQAIQKGWIYLQEEWLVKYPFQHAKAPELEWYSNGNSYAGDYLSRIWIPVTEK